MRPIRRPDSATPAPPPVQVDRSLRTKLRTGKLTQSLSSREEVDEREPDALFEPMPPATRGNATEEIIE
ncbi:MAG: hypothetical protein ABFD69_04390 [Candidatus Sumerlaeia bacterium]